MKITKARLHQLIKEEVARLIETGRSPIGWSPNDQEYADEMSNREYSRGYQDGLESGGNDELKADDATTDYDAGWEDGKLDATLPEPDLAGPWGSRLTETRPRHGIDPQEIIQGKAFVHLRDGTSGRVTAVTRDEIHLQDGRRIIPSQVDWPRTTGSKR